MAGNEVVVAVNLPCPRKDYYFKVLGAAISGRYRLNSTNVNEDKGSQQSISEYLIDKLDSLLCVILDFKEFNNLAGNILELLATNQVPVVVFVDSVSKREFIPEQKGVFGINYLANTDGYILAVLKLIDQFLEARNANKSC